MNDTLVKCKICGNKIEKSVAYKIVINNKNNYYCNESEYRDWILNKEIKDNTYNLIYEIFGRKVTNTILFKEVGELSDIYTYKKIYVYLEENKVYLCNVMRKEFSSEYAQIRYFAAILKNSLVDFQFEKETKVKKIEVDIPEYKFSRKNKRKPLKEYEEEVGDEL